jgi:WD40 repeat protein
MSAMAWSPDGTRIATTWGTSIKVWDAATGDEQLTIDGLVKWTDVVWSPDGTRIAAARDDGRGAKVYRATTGDELATLDPRRFGGVQELDWSPDGARLVTAGHDGTARVWDAAIGAELGTLTGHAGPVNDVAWSPDGTRIATASSDGTARIWQVGSYGPTRWPGPR